MVGKKILIKSIAQAIPTFAMSCFDLTKNFCDQVRAMICHYCWSNQDKDKMHWLVWDILKQPKHEGGLGFHDLHAFNMVILAKKGCATCSKPKFPLCTSSESKILPEWESFTSRCSGWNVIYKEECFKRFRAAEERNHMTHWRWAISAHME
jgi:hypothetical protein